MAYGSEFSFQGAPGWLACPTLREGRVATSARGAMASAASLWDTSRRHSRTLAAPRATVETYTAPHGPFASHSALQPDASRPRPEVQRSGTKRAALVQAAQPSVSQHFASRGLRLFEQPLWWQHHQARGARLAPQRYVRASSCRCRGPLRSRPAEPARPGRALCCGLLPAPCLLPYSCASLPWSTCGPQCASALPSASPSAPHRTVCATQQHYLRLRIDVRKPLAQDVFHVRVDFTQGAQGDAAQHALTRPLCTGQKRRRAQLGA